MRIIRTQEASEDVESVGGGLTGSAACTGVDGFIPLVGAGHREGALVHAIFTAAKRRPARLEGCAAVGVRSAWKIKKKFKINARFLFCVQLFEFFTCRIVFFKLRV